MRQKDSQRSGSTRPKRTSRAVTKEAAKATGTDNTAHTQNDARGTTEDDTQRTAPAKRRRLAEDEGETRKRRKERFTEIDIELFFDYWRHARPGDRPKGTTRRLTERYMEERQYQRESGQEDVGWIWFLVLDKFLKGLQDTKDLDLDQLLAEDDYVNLDWDIPPPVTAKNGELAQLHTMTEKDILKCLKDTENQGRADLLKWSELSSGWIDKYYNEAIDDASDMRYFMSQYKDLLTRSVSESKGIQSSRT